MLDADASDHASAFKQGDGVVAGAEAGGMPDMSGAAGGSSGQGPNIEEVD